MSDLDHSLLIALRNYICPVVYETAREVIREEMGRHTSAMSQALDRAEEQRRRGDRGQV